MSDKKYIDLGQVTAYAYAVEHGYTGTEEEFAIEQAQFAQNAQQVAEDRVVVREDRTHVDNVVETFTETTAPEAVQRVTTEGDTQVARVQGVGNDAVQDVTDTKDQALQDIDDAGDSEVNDIQAEGNTQVGLVRTEGTTQVGNVNTAGTTQVSAVNQAGNTQVGLVQAEGNTQVQNVEDKGQEIIDALPPNYEEDMAQVEDFLENLVKVSDTQPSSEANKLWIEDQAEEEIEVPTYEEFESLSNDVSDAKNAISQKAPLIINTASGDIASFADGADGMPIKKIVGTIVPAQSGTGDPSPNNVRPISGYTGANINDSVSNWLDADYMFDADNYSILGSYGYNYTPVFYLKPNTNYYFDLSWIDASTSFEFGNYIFAIHTNYDLTAYATKTIKTIVGGSGNKASSFTFTTGPTGAVRFLMVGADSTKLTAVKNALNHVQINLGASALPYEPFQGQTLPINWQTEAGTIYNGMITLNEDESVDLVDNGISVDLGTLTFSEYGDHCWCSTIAGVKRMSNSADQVLLACDSYKILTPRSILNSGQDKCVWMYGSTNNARLVIRNDDYIIEGHYDMSAFQASLVGVYAVFIRDTNRTYHFDNIGQLYTFLGTNNVWIDTGAITECDYPADTKLYIDGLTEPDEDMIADGLIASGKYFTVNNQLYLSTAQIAAGAQIIPGSNCTATNLVEALNALNT